MDIEKLNILLINVEILLWNSRFLMILTQESIASLLILDASGNIATSSIQIVIIELAL